MTMMVIAGEAFAVFSITFLVLAFVFARPRRSHHGTAGANYSSVDALECVHYGATLLKDGYGYYPDWCKLMLRQFDESIGPNLQTYFQLAREVAEQPYSQWGTVIEQHFAKNTDDPIVAKVVPNHFTAEDTETA